MDSPLGNTAATVIELIRAEPWNFDFFATILLFERIQQHQASTTPDVGMAKTPDLESIRFHTAQQQSYSASDVVRVESSNSAGPKKWDVTVSMMGLTGPNGIMPNHYSRLVMDKARKASRESNPREKKRYSTLPDFLDNFNHRQISLFYRAWKKYRLPALYRPQLKSNDTTKDDPVTTALYSLVGLANGPHKRQQTLRHRSEFPDEAILYYAGAFARWPRSPVTLKNLIAEMFGLPTEILEFQPQWCQLRPNDQYRMPVSGHVLGSDSALGLGITIGERICLYDTRFRIRLGPLSRADFDRLLPEGDRLRSVVQFARQYSGVQWDFDIQLVLKKEEVPMTRLGGSTIEPSQLARNSWSLNSAPINDQDQVVLRLDELN